MPERGDFSPAHRSRIRIGFGPVPQQAGTGPRAEKPGVPPADCNFTMRGVESFAYDLIVRPGRVSGRVILLLRSAERKPVRRLDLTFSKGASPPSDLPLSVGAGRGSFGSVNFHRRVNMNLGVEERSCRRRMHPAVNIFTRRWTACPATVE